MKWSMQDLGMLINFAPDLTTENLPLVALNHTARFV